MLCAYPAAPAVTGPMANPVTTEPAPELPALTIGFLREHTRALSCTRQPPAGSDGARAFVLSIVEDIQALCLEPVGRTAAGRRRSACAAGDAG
jgi:hypothetical protein